MKNIDITELTVKELKQILAFMDDDKKIKVQGYRQSYLQINDNSISFNSDDFYNSYKRIRKYQYLINLNVEYMLLMYNTLLNKLSDCLVQLIQVDKNKNMHLYENYSSDLDIIDLTNINNLYITIFDIDTSEKYIYKWDKSQKGFIFTDKII